LRLGLHAANVATVGACAELQAFVSHHISLFPLCSTNSAVFRPDPEKKLDIVSPRALYCLIHGAALLFAVYRVNLLGLLPTRLGDWIAAVQAPTVQERAVTGLLFPWRGT
jgi:hypothetical protein